MYERALSLSLSFWVLRLRVRRWYRGYLERAVPGVRSPGPAGTSAAVALIAQRYRHNLKSSGHETKQAAGEQVCMRALRSRGILIMHSTDDGSRDLVPAPPLPSSSPPPPPLSLSLSTRLTLILLPRLLLPFLSFRGSGDSPPVLAHAAEIIDRQGCSLSLSPA